MEVRSLVLRPRIRRPPPPGRAPELKTKVRFRLSLAIVLAGAIGGGQGALCAAGEVDYERHIKPLFVHKCAVCHGSRKQQAGLRLDAGVLIRKGGDNGPVVVPGEAAESVLIRKVTAEDPDERMPPDGEGAPLDAGQVALLSAWIDAGAVIPDKETIPSDPRRHWAYQIPRRPPLPRVDDADRANPIDAFIGAEQRRLGLRAVNPADRHTVLRRVYLDLIGLPPTRRQLREFSADGSSSAWLNVVDALLQNPHHGERWGRHWMDVWRYSDWDGYKQELRGSQRHIWRWRDWIVQSLNGDKGYDRMIVEMLAGDEIAPDDPDVLPATGFLARNFHNRNRNIWLDATVEHTAKAFLGMTLNCARCHDHKYDPIAQPEYYRFRAIFEPHNVRTDRLPGQSDVVKDGLPRAFDAEPEAKTFLYLRGNEKHPDKDSLTPAVPAALSGRFVPRSVELPLAAIYPAIKSFARAEDLAEARRQLVAAEEQLADANQNAQDGAGATVTAESTKLDRLELRREVAELRLQTLEARYAADSAKYDADGSQATGERREQLARAAADAERRLNARQAELTVREKEAALQSAKAGDEQDTKKKQAAIASAQKDLTDTEQKLGKAREALKETNDRYTPLGKEYPRTSTGRRLALARWIASPENALTARVSVNHIWLRHFGSPLVDGVSDFGLRSPRPRHAELLDWLAVEFMETGWSMKHLHRLIVTSRTWQLASTADALTASANMSIDPDNHYLWKAHVRRLDAEIIRDNLLAVSDQLDRTLGGKDIDFREGESSRRRSIYLRHAYEKQMTMLVLFDAASPNECYRRSESIVPQQALALTNSSLALSQSRLLARRLSEEIPRAGEDSESQYVQQAFLQTLSRPPAKDELNVCLQFLTDQAATLSDRSKLTTLRGGEPPKVKAAADPHDRARENLVHVLMNHNDFVTIR